MKRIVGKNQKTIRKRAVSLLLALFLIFSPFESMAFATGETEENRANNSSPVIGQDHPTQPGQVMLFKEAKKVPGMVNTFDVTLRMEAKDINKTSDIVLVIDTSGSMNQNQRMRRAREAANAFVDRLLPSSTTRIAVVSFAGEVYTKQDLTNNQNALHTAINGLAANGGTFTQAGIKRAREILSNSQADFKHIVLLSDGEPTYSYQIGNGYNASTYFSENIDPNIDIPEQAFTNTRIGYGNALTWPRRNPTHNNGNNAIAESKYAKNAAQSIWTIGLETNNIGDQVMGAVASPGQFYHGTPEELNTIFGEIAGKISSAMKNAHVTDSMGVGFEIPVGEVSNIQAIPANPAPTYNTSETPHKLLWNPGTITTPIEPGSDVKYAQLKYRVVINDNILKLGKPEDGMYNTNSSASVTYVDIDGNTQTSSFPQPNVKPIIIEMKKVLKDSQGHVISGTDETDHRTFNFNLKLQEEGSFNQNYLVKSNAARIMTDLRFDKHYTLTENGFSGTPASTQSDYDINVEWKTWNNTQSGQGSGNSLSNWKIPKGPDGASLNTTITVTNQEKADGKLTITKKFNPILPEGEIMGGEKTTSP